MLYMLGACRRNPWRIRRSSSQTLHYRHGDTDDLTSFSLFVHIVPTPFCRDLFIDQDLRRSRPTWIRTAWLKAAPSN